MGRAKTESKGEAKRRFSGFWDTIRTLIYAVLAALIVRTVAIEPFNIPSGSMIPTLLVGDYLFVSKYAYGYSTHSLPWSVDFFDGRIIDSPPDRGDVAVFKLPRDNSTDYIKRIVGLPGDRLQVLKGVLHINGTPVIRERVDDYSYTDRYGRERVL
ncbi:MAG: signal peptidase I, partial [Rhodospirillaceae bacterium]|nr:signal peptidase I [Rhodospirillaceae bacterium]